MVIGKEGHRAADTGRGGALRHRYARHAHTPRMGEVTIVGPSDDLGSL